MSAQHSVIQHIAQPYATALYDLALESKDVAGVEKSLDSIVSLIDSSEDFSSFLHSPAISIEQKARALDAILAKAKTSDLVEKFLKLVAENGRLFALSAIIDTFKARAAEERGEVSADVTSAAPLSAAQKKSLADTLKKKVGKTVTINAHVDPSLIGGLQVKVGSQMIDSSLKTKLAAMKVAMKEVG